MELTVEKTNGKKSGGNKATDKPMNRKTITVKKGDILAMETVLREIMFSHIDAKSAYWFSRTYDLVDDAHKDITESSETLVKKYGVLNEVSKQYEIMPNGANAANHQEAFKKLCSEDVTVDVFVIDINRFLTDNYENTRVFVKGSWFSVLRQVIIGEPEERFLDKVV